MILKLSLKTSSYFEGEQKHNSKQSTDAGLDDYPCTFGDSDARVIIIDDDHRGIFSFEKDNVVVDEKEGEAVLVVKRFKGRLSIIILF